MFGAYFSNGNDAKIWHVFLAYYSCSVDDILLLKDEKLFLIIVSSTFVIVLTNNKWKKL